MRQLTPELHATFKTAAKRFSPTLAREISAIGPIGYQRRTSTDLGVHLARIVVGQQLSTLAARSIWARVETAGSAKGRVLDFCTEQNHETLRACGLSNNKVKALIGLRAAEADGALDERKLKRLNPFERSQALTALWGIGAWTADMVSMFYFHEPDIWPLGDLSVRKTFERFVATQERYDLEAAANLFAPYRSFLAIYMWRIANNGPDE
ncbi:MAG: DNA-3-methyladenine glycosylase 2 family protein [Gammaproteobacteria bacterium]|nr:DNA-3-methyladenine glycosylase 2 family protein [Gammaproteobacteria bacterium]